MLFYLVLILIIFASTIVDSPIYIILASRLQVRYFHRSPPSKTPLLLVLLLPLLLCYVSNRMGKSLVEKEAQKVRENRLQEAIANNDVVGVHYLIAEERELLDRLSKHPFPNTPLHLAAAAGKTQVAMELAILKPSFARKLNPDGYSPMHLALQHKNDHTVRALITLDPKLIRVRGCYGITPLHYLAEKEEDQELELLAEFLRACGSSIEDLTSRCETAVHIAVKKHNLEAFKVLRGWLKRVSLKEILNWKDEDGNTVLHIAMSEKQNEVWHMPVLFIEFVAVHAFIVRSLNSM